MSNPALPARPGGRSIRLTTALGAVALACWQAHVVAWQVWPAPAGQAAPSPIVVVLPFANLGGQPEDDWIGAGIAETVATDLRTAGATVVVPGAGRSGASGDGSGNGGAGNGGNGGSDTDAWGGERFGLDGYRALGAEWIVEGGHRRSGDRLRLTARIVALETGGIAYSAHVDSSLPDIFDAQDAIAEALVERLVPPVPVAPSRPLGPAEGVTGTLALADAPPPAGAPFPVDARPARPDPAAASDPPAQAASDGRAARRRPRPGGFATVPLAARPTTVITRTREAPRIDGRLDDAVWRNATHLTEFVQIAPVEGAPGSERTEVWMAYDDDNLYFAFYAHYSDPGMIRVFRADRDEIRATTGSPCCSTPSSTSSGPTSSR